MKLWEDLVLPPKQTYENENENENRQIESSGFRFRHFSAEKTTSVYFRFREL